MRLYLRFLGVQFKCAMQYKVSFLLTVLGQFLVSFNLLIGIYYMFERFHKVRDYQYSEVLLCFSIVLISFSFAEMFMRGFDLFASTISNGEFDRILLRPRGIILQVVGNRVEFARIGRFLQAIVVLIYGIVYSEIDWTLDKILTLIFMIMGGVVVFTCLFIIYASLCFFTLEGLEFMNILTDGAREYGKYPINVYGKAVLKFCTYLVPYSLFQYYPFLYLTGRVDRPIYMLFPATACLFLIPSYLFWRYGVRHYKSTGS